MNARGERILIFGDSLSRGGSDSGPTVYDVTQGFNRASSAPGDLLASLFLEQGATAARVNARVGRSAYNFWQREDANTLIAGDRGFAPTKVIVILGTNDVGLDLAKDRQAMEKIRDAYKAMGAEVWAVGPFISAQDLGKTLAVTQMMSSVFGGRFLDGRMLSHLAEHSGDGVHYTQAGARTLALAMGERLLATISPTIVWTGVAIGAGALLAVGLGLLLGKKMSRTRGVLADIAAGAYNDVPEHAGVDLSGDMLGAIDIVEGRKHKGSTNDLVRKGYEQVPCASGLDKGSKQARCWAKPIPKRLAGPELAGLVLPDFEITKKQPNAPHVACTIAERIVPNEHGAKIKYVVEQSRNGKEWWIHASLNGMRMSNTLHTADATKAQTWIDAVQSGDVSVHDSYESSMPTAPTKPRKKRKTPEHKALEAELDRLYQQGGYAGNTPEDNARIDTKIAAVRAKISGLGGRAPRTGPNAAIDSRASHAWFAIENAHREFPDAFKDEYEQAKAIVKGDDWQWDQKEDIVKAFEKTARSIRQRAAKMRKAKTHV